MAIKIKRINKFVPKWRDNDQLPENEQVSLYFSTLTVEDMFDVQRQTGLNLFAGVPVDVENTDSFVKFWEMCRYLVSKYTKDWQNVELEEQALVTAEDVLEGLGADCLQLFIEVANEIITRSMGTGEQVKNSASQSEPKSGDSASTAEVVSPPSSSSSETAEIGM